MVERRQPRDTFMVSVVQRAGMPHAPLHAIREGVAECRPTQVVVTGARRYNSVLCHASSFARRVA